MVDTDAIANQNNAQYLHRSGFSENRLAIDGCSLGTLFANYCLILIILCAGLPCPSNGLGQRDIQGLAVIRTQVVEVAVVELR